MMMMKRTRLRPLLSSLVLLVVLLGDLLATVSSFPVTGPIRHVTAAFKPTNPVANKQDGSLVRGSRHISSSTTALRAAAAAPLLALPSLQTVALSCLLPTSLGFWRYEYGVSYGYGTSVALTAFWFLRNLTPDSSVAYWHALALVFYGVRLNLFLLYREIFIPRFRRMRESIEERRGGGGRGRLLSRLPFVLGCAALYACLSAAPLSVTSRSVAGGVVNTAPLLLSACVACSWVGFVAAALGDLQKAVTKAVRGEDVLVTGGLFALLRHPNYTCEALGWTASYLASLVAAVVSWDARFILPLTSALFGWVGIVGVLSMAATALEKKQQEKYEDDPEYARWTKRSWAGPTLASK